MPPLLEQTQTPSTDSPQRFDVGIEVGLIANAGGAGEVETDSHTLPAVPQSSSPHPAGRQNDRASGSTRGGCRSDDVEHREKSSQRLLGRPIRFCHVRREALKLDFRISYIGVTRIPRRHPARRPRSRIKTPRYEVFVEQVTELDRLRRQVSHPWRLGCLQPLETPLPTRCASVPLAEERPRRSGLRSAHAGRTPHAALLARSCGTARARDRSTRRFRLHDHYLSGEGLATSPGRRARLRDHSSV